MRIIEIPDKNGNTPLMNVTLHEHVDLVELFITKGANINHQNEAGKTALMLACFNHSIPMIKELRNYGAKYELKDRNGCIIFFFFFLYRNYANIFSLNSRYCSSFCCRWW